MRKLTAIVSAICLMGMAVYLSARPQALSAEQVVEKALAALGGKEALEKIQTQVISGKAEDSAGSVRPYQLWRKAPDKTRRKMDVGGYLQERVFDGTRGWWKQTYENIINVYEISGPELARVKRASTFNPLLFYLKAGVPMEIKGKDKIKGAEAYVVQFSPQEGSPEFFYFDSHSFLLLREVRQVPTNQGEVKVTIDYSDYRKVGQIMLPFSTTEVWPAETATLKVDEYQLNVPLDDDFFKVEPATPGRESSVTPAMTELNNPDQLRDLFQSDRGKVRLISLLSPT